jgi:peroxiredoxin
MKYLNLLFLIIVISISSCGNVKNNGETIIDITIKGMQADKEYKWQVNIIDPYARQTFPAVDIASGEKRKHGEAILELVNGNIKLKSKLKPGIYRLENMGKSESFIFAIGEGYQELVFDVENFQPTKGTDFKPNSYTYSHPINDDLFNLWKSPGILKYESKMEEYEKWYAEKSTDICGVSPEEFRKLRLSKKKEDKERANRISENLDMKTYGDFQKEAYERRKKITILKDKASIDFLVNNPDSYVAMDNLLLNVMLYGTDDPNAEIMKTFMPCFSDKLKLTESYIYINKIYESAISSQVGALVPDFELPDPEGNMLKLSSLRGKYVIVDFWASWCGYCRKETPNLKEQYKKYKDEGLEILSVSFDTDDKAWRKAMKHDDMPWLQVVDKTGVGKSDLIVKYGNVGLPFIFLIDKEGRMIAKKLRYNSKVRENDMNERLKSVFGF